MNLQITKYQTNTILEKIIKNGLSKKTFLPLKCFMYLYIQLFLHQSLI